MLWSYARWSSMSSTRSVRTWIDLAMGVSLASMRAANWSRREGGRGERAKGATLGQAHSQAWGALGSWMIEQENDWKGKEGLCCPGYGWSP